MNRKNWNSKCN